MNNKYLLLLGALIGLTAPALNAEVAPPKTVSVNYASVIAKAVPIVQFNAHVELEAKKIKAASDLKITARESLVKQANEFIAKNPEPNAEQKSKLQPMLVAIESLENEIRAIQAAPEFTKEVAAIAAELRSDITAAVKAETQAAGGDLAIDTSSLNALGLPVFVTATSSPILDITDAVIARLNTVSAEAETGK